MKNMLPTVIFVVVLLAIDLYAFKSLKLVTSDWQKLFLKNSILIAYWIASAVAYGLIIYAISVFNSSGLQRADYYIFFMGFAVLLVILIPKLIISLFHLFDDIIHLLRSISGYFIQTKNPGESITNNGITRWQFLSRTGWVLAALPFISILYGVASGRFNFRILKNTLSFSNLPKSADGLRIVHISDIHIGSFFKDFKSVKPGLDKINDLKPDLILFTGDMINNYAEELDGWVPYLSALKAKYGKYSILGNHDYGDYVNWPSSEAKAENLQQLKNGHEEMGFHLLLNEKAEIETAPGESFELLGVENWGLGGFSKHGDLEKAMSNSNSEKFQILMSHDPSHWNAQVTGKTKIDLTLSGHTHGMQFGIEIPGLVKWSPAKYRYKHWGGLYSENDQFIYVNRGFGYIGFPGRIGMSPEITVIDLKKS
ncbi:MAG TPA: metallophosphoesterase [Cryomorphaceae bacterium]|nr:metallophosphoesterase [Cryomorphaceae bacterium]